MHEVHSVTNSSSRPNQPIKLLLVENQATVLEGVRSFLEKEPSLYQVVGEAKNGQEGLDWVGLLKPDVVLFDIDMPVKSGLDMAREISKKMPQVKLLALSGHSDQLWVGLAKNAGASGYLTKDATARTVKQAIQDVCAGKTVFPVEEKESYNARRMRGIKVKSLTPKEKEVLLLILTTTHEQDRTNARLAERLDIGQRTLETHLQNVYAKLGVPPSKDDLIAQASKYLPILNSESFK